MPFLRTVSSFEICVGDLPFFAHAGLKVFEIMLSDNYNCKDIALSTGTCGEMTGPDGKGEAYIFGYIKALIQAADTEVGVYWS